MEDIPYDQLKHAFEVLQELDEFREAKQHCDFVIRVGPKEIHVHRNVLCANSEYFKAMLLHDTVENQSGMVELKDMDADCAALCADFMYGKKISISREKWETLMYSADRLQLHKLRAFLEKFLVSSLAADTFYDIRRIANLYNCAELQKSCEEFAPENFESISQLEEFHQVDQEYVISMLTSKLNTTSETIKMKALLSWIKAEVENRSKVLLSMLKTINLSSIPLHNLRYWLEKDDLISQSFECSKLLTTSVMDAVGIPAVEPDATGDNFNCIALFDGRSRHLQCFNPQKNTLTQMHELLHDMNEDNFTAITLHNNIFVLMKDKRVFRLTYTSTKATWERKADTLHEHGLWPPVVADSRYIYVVGCWGEEVSLPSIEKYDTITNRWTWLSNHKEIQESSCALLHRKIFCIGGRKGDIFVDAVEVFDLDSNQWSSAAPLLESRCLAGAAVSLGKLYVMGGQGDDWDELDSVEVYDPKIDAWKSLNSMFHAASNFPVLAVGDRIFTRCMSFSSPELQKYRIGDGEWTKITIPGNINLNPLWCTGIILKQ